MRIEAEVARPRPGMLAFSYFVSGTMSDLCMPPLAAAVRADELWRHTCFEAFVRPAPGAAYYEFNFAPSTQWAAYRFDSYRRGMRVAAEIGAPVIDVHSAPECYALQALLNVAPLLASPTRGGRNEAGDPAWHVGLSAVIEETSGRKSYWALAHPPGNPDFHHADCFVHEVC
jgi:hypothetical protein